MPTVTNITLGPGFISYISSSASNDFASMPVGATTTLSGWTIHGNASVGMVSFTPRM